MEDAGRDPAVEGRRALSGDGSSAEELTDAAVSRIQAVYDSAVQKRITASRARTRAAQLEQEAAPEGTRPVVYASK